MKNIKVIIVSIAIVALFTITVVIVSGTADSQIASYALNCDSK